MICRETIMETDDQSAVESALPPSRVWPGFCSYYAPFPLDALSTFDLHESAAAAAQHSCLCIFRLQHIYFGASSSEFDSSTPWFGYKCIVYIQYICIYSCECKNCLCVMKMNTGGWCQCLISWKSETECAQWNSDTTGRLAIKSWELSSG